MKAEDITEEWILNEVEKIKYTYGLNKIIRYNLKREEKFQTQSVAEHVTNMLILAHYFKDLEDPNNKLNFEKVVRMIFMHDMGEIETGDIIMDKKTQKHFETEIEEIKNVAEKSPNFIKKEIIDLVDEFDFFKTPEGRYVKAIDKLEGQIFWSCVNSLEMIKHVNNKEAIIGNEAKRAKAYSEAGYPIIQKFGKFLYENAVKRGLLD